MNEFTFKEFQSMIDDWARQYKKPYFEPLSMMACLTEETGEVARVMNNLYGDKKKKDGENIKNLSEELADLIFSATCIANANNIDLTLAMKEKFKKINLRDNLRWEKVLKED